MHYPRETFNARSVGKVVQPYIGVRILGISWFETWEAAVGFLSDSSVSCGHFSEWQLQLLKSAVEERLNQIAKDR